MAFSYGIAVGIYSRYYDAIRSALPCGGWGKSTSKAGGLFPSKIKFIRFQAEK